MSAAGTPPVAAKSSTKWIVIALIVVGLGAVSAQFGPMIAAATREGGITSSHRPVDLARTQPVSAAFSRLSSGGGPPEDVLASLAAPRGSATVGTDDYDGNSGTYDRAVDLSGPMTQEAVLSFYETYLPEKGWSVKGEYPVPNASGREVIATRAGSDGYEWEVAVADPAPQRSAHTFQIRLQLVDDEE